MKKRRKEEEQQRKNEDEKSKKEEHERKTKEKQRNIKRLPVREEKHLYGKHGSLEDVLLTKKVQTDAKETMNENQEWIVLDDTNEETEEWEQDETEKEKMNRKKKI